MMMEKYHILAYAILLLRMEFINEEIMKAIMSNTLREIINDPKKSEELQKGVSKLHDSNRKANKEAVSIGGKSYKVKLINRNS